MLSYKVDDEVEYEKMIFEKDFLGRSMLKIITDNHFFPLMDQEDPKAVNIMQAIYKGKESTRCDGNI